jgi:hypothetical protein
MRIRIVQKPPVDDVDGIRLDVFQHGFQYDVGNQLGALLLAERWGEPVEPVESDEPAMLIPVREFTADAATRPNNLTREFWPPYYTAPPEMAADRRLRPRPGPRRKSR